MKHNQGGAKISYVLIWVAFLGLAAWFNQANAMPL